jgi:glucose 1-dehydrogenase
MRLRDKVAIVTGSAGGIGRGTALRLAEEGARIVVADIDEAGSAETVAMIQALGGQALAVTTDVTVADLVQRMVAQTVATFGGLDILVNNAGVLGRLPLLEVSEETFDHFMAVNVKGPFLCSQAAVRWWLEHQARGVIVNVASVESAVAFPDQVPYAASKGAVLMLTRALALDLARHGIRVNAVGPGTVDSRGRWARAPERRRQYEGYHPLGRLGKPDDVANAILFLASDEAEWITGEILYVDGGYLVRGP